MKKAYKPTALDSSDARLEIKKHSSIVQMGNVTTLQERKAMNSLIWIARDILKRNPEERSFHCDIWIVKRLAGLNDSDNATLKEALRNLSHTKIEYNILNKDKEVWWTFSFLAEVKITSGGRGKSTTVSFEFPSTIWRVIQHPRMYVVLDLLVLRSLKSKHSVALYELMKDYQKLGQYSCGIKEFRKLMGIKPKQYTVFTMLKTRVLDKAVNEINEKTDVTLSYKLTTKGRKVNAIHLHIQTRNKNLLMHNKPDAIEQKLKAFWIREKRVKAILKEHDEQYLRANIAIVEEQVKKGKVRNPTAYLLKAFQDDYSTPETEYTKQLKEESAQKKMEKEEAEKATKEEKEKRQAFNKMKAILVKNRLKKLEHFEVEKLNEAFLEKTKSNPLLCKLLDAKWIDSSFLQVHRYKFLEPKLLTEKEQDFEWFKS